MTEPRPVPLVAALPQAPPFVAPETLERRAGHPLLRLGANESAFGISPRARDAMVAAVDEISWYGDPEAYDLRGAIAAREKTERERVAVGPGIDALLGDLVRAYGAGGEAVVTAGTYPTFFYHLAGYGVRPVTAPYAADGTLPLGDLVALARDRRPRLVYVANPDNPSGTAVPRAALEAVLAELPPESLVLLDEAYADFLDPAELPRLAPDAPVVRLRTFSKAHGLAGARVAYALAPPEVVRTLDLVRLHFGVSRVALAGALASLGDERFVATVALAVAEGREEYEEIAASLGLGTLRSRTNFVAFDLGTVARAEATLAALARHGVFVRKPGAGPIARCIRVTIGRPEQRRVFARSLAEALAESGPNGAAT